jgi:predicted histidine transporter YuiF (NhaC family)
MGKSWAGVFRFVGIGWYIAFCILLGTLGGRWLGQKLDGTVSEAIFTILGLMLGLLVAFFGTYRMFKSMQSENQNTTKENN